MRGVLTKSGSSRPLGRRAGVEEREGSLCVFEAVNINATGFQALVGSEIEASQVGNGTTGAQVILASTAAGLVFANGTWAVTAN